MGYRGISFSLILLQLVQVPGALALDLNDISQAAAMKNAGLTPEINALGQQAFGDIFTKCIDPAGAIGKVANCMTVDIGNKLDESKISCPLIMAGSKVDSTKVENLREELEKSVDAQECRQAKLKSMETELSCLNAQSANLTQQIGSMQQAYVENIQRMQKDVFELKAAEAERQNQIGEVKSLLMSDRDRGTVGLLAMKERLLKTVATIPQEVRQADAAAREVEVQRKALSEEIQFRTGGMAFECLKTRSESGFKCEKNGKPVGLRDYVLCRYEQNQHLTSSGKIQKDKLTDKRAESKTSELASVIDAIFSEAPAAPVPITSQDQAQKNAAANQSARILNPNDFKARYADKLAQFNGKGLNISSFVSKAFDSCFTDSQVKINKERTQKTSQLGVAQEAILNKEKDASAGFKNIMNKYSEEYASAMSELTGQHLPLNMSACENAPLKTQGNCLRDIAKNLEGLVNGNVKQAQMNIIIKANNPKAVIPVKCSGLSGCIRSLQNVQQNLTKETFRLAQMKQQYVQQSNQSIERFTKEMATRMSGQSQQLNSRLKDINSQLASLGITRGVDIRPMKGDPLRPDEDGLLKPPENIISTIGGQMNPPMLDVEGDNFSSALSGIAKEKTRSEEDLEEVKTAQQTLEAKVAECAEVKIEKMASAAEADIEQLGTLNCGYVDDVCDGSEKDPIYKLTQTVSSLSTTSDLDEDVVAGLQSGVSGLCSKKEDQVLRGQQLASKKELEEKIAGLRTKLEESERSVTAARKTYTQKKTALEGTGQVQTQREALQTRFDDLSRQVAEADRRHTEAQAVFEDKQAELAAGKLEDKARLGRELRQATREVQAANDAKIRVTEQFNKTRQEVDRAPASTSGNPVEELSNAQLAYEELTETQQREQSRIRSDIVSAETDLAELKKETNKSVDLVAKAGKNKTRCKQIADRLEAKFQKIGSASKAASKALDAD